MSGGINESQQFIGIQKREPYSAEMGPVITRYDNTESGIAEAHGHADQLAERIGVPREAIQVSRFTSSSTSEPLSPPTNKPAKKTAVPKKDEVVITKGGKSTTKKLGGKK